MRHFPDESLLGIQKSRKKRPVASPPGGFANGFLALPTLSKQVPIRSVSQDDNEKWLQIAMLCSELVGEDEVDIQTTDTARDIISKALSVWASKHCADISVLDSFEFIVALTNEELEYNMESETNPEAWYLGLLSNQTAKYINVKYKVDVLERLHPGLGRTAIHYAEIAGYRTVQVFSPNVGFGVGQNFYWLGMTDDKDVLEEREVNGCAEENDEEEDFFLPSQYKAAFPELYFTGECLGREALQIIAADKNIAGEAANVILSIMDLEFQNASMPGMDNYFAEPIFFSCYLGLGDEPDMLSRVLDDHFQYVNEGGGEGFTEMHGIAEVTFNKELFLQWRDDMEKGFALYKKLDHLVRIIGEIEN